MQRYVYILALTCQLLVSEEACGVFTVYYIATLSSVGCVHVQDMWRSILCYLTHTHTHTHRGRGDERDPVDLEPDTQCILKYRPVSSLVQSGAVRLV